MFSQTELFWIVFFKHQYQQQFSSQSYNWYQIKEDRLVFLYQLKSKIEYCTMSSEYIYNRGHLSFSYIIQRLSSDIYSF